jgi:4-amino-4-deoxy-L-arabinose transferase-like glycosyltransferase
VSTSRFTTSLALAVALAAVLRFFPLLSGAPAHHPDEFNFIYWPLYLFNGDFNPQHTVTAFYPALQYYLLGVLYLVYFGLLTLGGVPWTMDQHVAYGFFWGADDLLSLARWTTAVFGVGTVLVTALVARELYGRTAAVVAGLLMALCSIHVRQSPLAAVDVPMAFWFAAAIWACVRVYHDGARSTYLLAGGLVGLATATKYPGVLAGAAVVAAHVMARRSWMDHRIWLASLALIGLFFLASPYTFFDYRVFLQHFQRESLHLVGGHGQDLGLGWWYHLKVSTRYAFGWVGFVVLWIAIVAAVRRRHPTLILLAAFGTYYLIMGSGHAVFVRYALPLFVLQAVLVAGWLGSIYTRSWRLIAILLTLVEPAYSSTRVSQLLSTTDTRLQARTWLDQHVTSGTTCCSFGGWAGDPAPVTVQELWWKIFHFERGFSRQQLDEVIPFLIETLDAPVFNFVSRHQEQQDAYGDMSVVEEFRCEYVLLHRHPLVYSAVDSSFAELLETGAHQVARFEPRGLSQSKPTYDPIDGYYVPIGHFGALRQPGPDIEIWQTDITAASSKRADSPKRSFARAYASVGARSLQEGDPAGALELALRGFSLDESYAGTYMVSAHAYRAYGQLDRARHLFEKALEIVPDDTHTLQDLGNLHITMGNPHLAAECFAKVLSTNPNNPERRRLQQFIQRQEVVLPH